MNSMYISSSTPEGFKASGRIKRVSSYRTWQFSGGWPIDSGWPAKNIHTDLEFAQACGLPNRAASGAMPLGYLADLMSDMFGDNWQSRGRMDVKFIGLILVGDEIVAHARVLGKQLDGQLTRFELELWCDNQRGEKVVVGTGSGWVK